MKSDKEEDVIELVQYSSASSKSCDDSKRRKFKNKIGSPPGATPTKIREVPEAVFIRPRPLLPEVSVRKKSHNNRSAKNSRTVTSASDFSSDSSDVEATKDNKSRQILSETNSAITSKSDARSYRDKIKDRFRSVKEKAGKSRNRAHGRDFRVKSEKIENLHEKIDSLRKETVIIDGELKEYKNNHPLEDSSEITRTEMYDFFCHQKPPETIQDDQLIEASLPEMLDSHVESSERENFWIPKGKIVDVYDKVDRENFRFLEEDGFYVGEKPRVAKFHLNILEERLLMANDRRWFNREGNLDTISNPYTGSSLRPKVDEEKENLTIFAPPSINPQNQFEEVVVEGDNILHLHINKVFFKHHPLFSLEHVFERKLLDLYEKYREKIHANKLQRTEKRLESIRKAKKNLLNTSTEGLDKKIQQYDKDIKKLRSTLFKESKEYRRTIKEILQTWKTIKNIRERQGYSSTTVKLLITKEETDAEAEKGFYEEMTRDTIEEVLQERQEDYERKLEHYRRSLQAWKNQNKEDEEKPKKPQRDYDEEEIRQEIFREIEETFKPPGEPIIHFFVKKENALTTEIDDAKEKLRRSAVSSTKIHAKITCEKMTVCKTKILSLDDSFECAFDESVSMQLNAIPEVINVRFYEQPGNLLKRRLGEVFIKTPKKTNDGGKIHDETFRQDEIVHYKHAGVGSSVSTKNLCKGYNLDIAKDYKEEILTTTAVVSYSISWESLKVPFEEKSQLDDFLLAKNGSVDLDKLKQWVEETQPDPQDPKNAVIFDYLRNLDDTPDDFDKKNCFRLNPHARQLQFCGPDKIDSNLRLKVLKLRNNNEPEFVGMVVPNRIKEIPTNVLSSYKRRLNEDTEEASDEEIVGNVDTRRNLGKKRLQQIHTKVFQKCRCAKNNLCFEDVVDEKYLAHFALFVKTFTSNFFNWFKLVPNVSKPLPKIATAKDEVEKVAFSEMASSECRILVNVVSATNLPLRSNGRLSPFVSVSYQNMSADTGSAQTENPVWNEELILPLVSTHTDYLNPNSLNGVVLVQIFDDIIEDDKDFRKKVWLGYIEIPISAICYSGKMEGFFKMRKPEMLFGYESEYDVYTSNSSTNTTHSSYLFLKISTEPNVIPKLHANMDELECNEPPYLRDHILKWNENYNASFGMRKFSALCVDVNGKTTCITRYIRPLEPPQISPNGFDVTADQCAKYVSLIPFTDCNKFYQNIWLNTDYFLKIKLGSVIDHAVALVCYLTALNLDVWLLLGFGIPQGSTAYVLVRETPRDAQMPSYYIYDVVYGDKYDITDQHCPLQKIYCVVNEYNVWANVQRNNNVSTTRFDLSRRMDWLQLFNNQISSPTNSVQTKLSYTTQDGGVEIEGMLYKKIRKKLMKLRKMNTTRFDHQLSGRVKNILVNFENNKMSGKTHFDAYKELSGYRNQVVNGYVLNMPYVSAQKIVNTIRLLEVHNFEKNLDFALAIYARGYPSQVFSVWIFIALLIENNT